MFRLDVHDTVILKFNILFNGFFFHIFFYWFWIGEVRDISVMARVKLKMIFAKRKVRYDILYIIIYFLFVLDTLILTINFSFNGFFSHILFYFVFWFLIGEDNDISIMACVKLKTIFAKKKVKYDILYTIIYFVLVWFMILRILIFKIIKVSKISLSSNQESEEMVKKIYMYRK